MKKLLALLLVLMISTVILTACGGDSDGLSGRYNVVAVTEGGETMTADQFVEFGLDLDEFYLEFIDNSNVRFMIFGEVEEGTYQLTGNSVAITIDGETERAVIDGNKITLAADGTEMVFEKS